jgi:hypothetical protein
MAASALGLFLLAAPTHGQTLVTAEASGSAVGTVSAKQGGVADDKSIRPFHIDVGEESLVDLHRRIAATRWPDRETVADQSQRVRLEKIRQLVEYWGTGYDWRKVEAKLTSNGRDIY